MPLRGSKADSMSEPKPTIYQFSSEIKHTQCPLDCPVDIIWLPKRWPNYTIDTLQFRVRIHEDSPLFSEFEEYFESCVKEGIPLQVTIEDKKGNWLIDRIPDKTCYWEEISTIGYRMTDLAKMWKPKPKTPPKE